jgi:hypothetical protein
MKALHCLQWRQAMMIAMLLVFVLSLPGQKVGATNTPAGENEASSWTGTEIPNLEMIAIPADPAPDAIVTTRLRSTRKVCMPPHSHPVDEQLTVIKGGISLKTTQAHPDTTRRLKAGETAVLKSGASYSATLAAGTEVELRGKGKLVNTWADPAAVRAMKQHPVDSDSERTKMKKEQDKR